MSAITLISARRTRRSLGDDVAAQRARRSTGTDVVEGDAEETLLDRLQSKIFGPVKLCIIGFCLRLQDYEFAVVDHKRSWTASTADASLE